MTTAPAGFLADLLSDDQYSTAASDCDAHSRDWATRPAEAVEPDAVVLYKQHPILGFLFMAYPDMGFRPGAGIFEGVGDEIDKHLVQQPRISVHFGQFFKDPMNPACSQFPAEFRP
jgi:hypothetical protein